MTSTMLDLFCGLGGASAPFLARGWRVIGIDLDPRVKPTIVADLGRGLPLRNFQPQLGWASPECTAFTRARLPWKLKPSTAELDAAIAMAVGARRAIEGLPFWVVENVDGSLPYLVPALGPITHRTWAHTFWCSRSLGGWLLPQVMPHKQKIPGRCSFTHHRRSIIPWEIGASLCRFIENRGELLKSPGA